MLGGITKLTIHPPIANFLWYICAKNYENWLAVDKVIAKIIRLTFLAHPVFIFPSHFTSLQNDVPLKLPISLA